jgi:hypothetical protein
MRLGLLAGSLATSFITRAFRSTSKARASVEGSSSAITNANFSPPAALERHRNQQVLSEPALNLPLESYG